jgi:hypothetical protein
MLLFCLLVIFSIIVYWFGFAKTREWDWYGGRKGSRRLPFVEAAILSGVTLVVGLFVTLFLTFIAASIAVPDHSVERDLVALADGQSTHGSFFLGSGSVDSDPAFFWYQDDGTGGYKLKSINAYWVTIREIPEGETPHMVQRCDDYSNIPKWVGWPLDISEDEESNSCGDSDEKSWTTFYVPAGSIKSNYILDAQ